MLLHVFGQHKNQSKTYSARMIEEYLGTKYNSLPFSWACFNCGFKNIPFSPLCFQSKKNPEIQFEVSYICSYVILRGLCHYVSPHVFLGTWVRCWEVNTSSSTINDAYLCSVLLPDNPPSKLLQHLWGTVVNLSPLWMGGRVAGPEGRRLCLIVACGHQCWWDLAWQWRNCAPFLERDGLL